MYENKKPSPEEFKSIFEKWLKDAKETAKKSGSKNDRIALLFLEGLSDPPANKEARKVNGNSNGTGLNNPEDNGGPTK